MADEANLPAVIHSRDACADTLEILRENRKLLRNGFLMHCYSYSAEAAAEYAALGGYFSFGGVVTFKNAQKVKKAALAVPADRILTETDSPYLAPEPVRGRRNEPLNVGHICRLIAALRQMDAQQLCDITRENGRRFYGIG